MTISLGTIKACFDKYNNTNDIIHLVDYELDEVFWTGKIKDVYEVKNVDKYIVGLASRHFCPKTNQYEDGVYLYVRRFLLV